MVDGFNKTTASDWLLMALAFLGLVQIAGDVLLQAADIFTSVIFLILSGVGTFILWKSVARKGDFKLDFAFYVAVGLIGLGLALYMFVPIEAPSGLASIMSIVGR